MEFQQGNLSITLQICLDLLFLPFDNFYSTLYHLMWAKLARFILINRLYLMIGVGVVTIVLGYYGRSIEMTYDFAKAVPDDDEDLRYFESFKSTFGEDGNILAIGMCDTAVYRLEQFRRLKYLSDELSRLEGVNNVLSLPRLQRLRKDSATRKFIAGNLFTSLPATQQELDSILEIGLRNQLYQGQLFNPQSKATVILVSIRKDVMNSEKRIPLVNELLNRCEAFERTTGIKLHYTGLPYVRATMATKVKQEFQLFIYLSLGVTALILFAFFRSWKAVLVPTLVIGVIIVWCTGTIVLLGYKITLLTGLIPPIIVVIGIPNCIYLLSKYHIEYRKHQNKIRALVRIIERVGMVTLITNLTTAIGFVVLIYTDIRVLKEFGIVAAINILATFIVSLILIPSIFAYLPPPNPKQLRHLDFNLLNRFLNLLDVTIHRHPRAILAVAGALLIVAVIGMSRVKAVAYMIDDLPETSGIKKDLTFFEHHFNGVMPFEIVVDLGKRNAASKVSNLRKVETIETFLKEQPELSAPVSLVGFAKTATFAYYNEQPWQYRLPSNQERNFVFAYLAGQQDSTGLLRSFVDSTGQYVRISLKMKDVGSIAMDSLIEYRIKPGMQEILQESDLKAEVTGTTYIFIKGNKFLVENLKQSLLLAVVLIACTMALLFGSLRMVIISLVPNILPLAITAGIMGYMGIPLKPSTAIVFSIAFGIAVDDAIHFLAKYRQELFAHQFFIPKAISISIKETGTAMMYTSVILFFGFVIFVFSDFGGTVALGLLTSITLICAMLTNLVLLPAMLLLFDTGKKQRRITFEPLIEHYDEFYQEDEDEEIDLNLIKLQEKEAEE